MHGSSALGKLGYKLATLGASLRHIHILQHLHVYIHILKYMCHQPNIDMHMCMCMSLYICSSCLCCMQVAPATQSSRVCTQRTQQHLQPQVGTTPLLGTAPGPQVASQVAVENILGPGDLSGRSVSPVPCQASLGHPAHSPETDQKPQAKRFRQQDPFAAPNVSMGVARVSLALQLTPPIDCRVLYSSQACLQWAVHSLAVFAWYSHSVMSMH